MPGNAALFSVKLAWKHVFLRWSVLFLFIIAGCVSSLFLLRVIPAARQEGVVVLHYSVYLGVDELRPWPWIFLLPAVFFFGLALDLMYALATFQRDAFLAYAAMTFGWFWTIAWIGALFYLTLANQ